MNKNTETFIAWAQGTGWTLETSNSDLALPSVLTRRYAHLPEPYTQFLQRVALLVTPDARAWFNSVADFAGTSGTAFAWNEWEQIGLASALDDQQAEETRKFWDRHVPVFMTVRDDYEYYAIDLTNGSVVYSYRDFFEEPTKTAASFTDFLDLIRAGKIRQTGPLQLTDRKSGDRLR